MYRAVTLGVLKGGIDVADRPAVEEFARTSALIVEAGGSEGNRILLNGEDMTAEIRSPKVTKNVSAISSYGAVRSVLVREQRKMAEQGGIVLEGRDIGTVVLPDAELKIFMVATVSERAKRRRQDVLKAGIEVQEEELVRDIEERDRKDSTRDVSPLKMAPDAIKVDTSNMTIDEQVTFIVNKAQEIIGVGVNE